MATPLALSTPMQLLGYHVQQSVQLQDMSCSLVHVLAARAAIMIE
jgi:hypothetical protein